jgi:sporulation protein YlmC with PRC-barrel domain
MENREKGKRNEAFIIYLNDDGVQISCYAVIIEKNSNWITFRTSKNLITIPFSRIIKIKEKLEDEND